MSFKVLVRPSGIQFFAEPTENILDAALRAGVGMPFGCKDGACGSCKARVLAGELEQGWHAAPALSHEEHVAGLALLCCAQPRSDLEIEVREVAGHGRVPAPQMPCPLPHPGHRTAERLLVPPQLHPDGPGRRRPARSVALYWGARARRDVYMNDLPMRWAGEQPNFRYIPVLSDALEEDAWTGRTGFVHQAVMQDLPDLSQHEVYACGAPVMVEAAHRDFVRLCRLPDDQFLADAFTSKADVVKD